MKNKHGYFVPGITFLHENQNYFNEHDVFLQVFIPCQVIYFSRMTFLILYLKFT
jgi:hypothetical protein